LSLGDSFVWRKVRADVPPPIPCEPSDCMNCCWRESKLDRTFVACVIIDVVLVLVLVLVLLLLSLLSTDDGEDEWSIVVC